MYFVYRIESMLIVYVVPVNPKITHVLGGSTYMNIPDERIS